jgi:hypothetical protein
MLTYIPSDIDALNFMLETKRPDFIYKLLWLHFGMVGSEVGMSRDNNGQSTVLTVQGQVIVRTHSSGKAEQQ